MDLISRLLDGYRYSACVSSATQFRHDILSEPLLGNTWETLRRFKKNITKKSGRREKVPKEDPRKAKTLYFDDNHISQFFFEGALETNTRTIQEIGSLLDDLGGGGESEAEKKLTEMWIRSESNRSLIEDMSGKWPWLVDHAKKYEERSRSKREKRTRSERKKRTR